MRERWRWIEGQGLVQVTDEARPRDASAYYMPDIKGFQSPIDESWIESRSQLAAHNKRHGVRQNGDFRRGELIAKEKARHAANMKHGMAKWV